MSFFPTGIKKEIKMHRIVSSGANQACSAEYGWKRQSNPHLGWTDNQLSRQCAVRSFALKGTDQKKIYIFFLIKSYCTYRKTRADSSICTSNFQEDLAFFHITGLFHTCIFYFHQTFNSKKQFCRGYVFMSFPTASDSSGEQPSAIVRRQKYLFREI